MSSENNSSSLLTMKTLGFERIEFCKALNVPMRGPLKLKIQVYLEEIKEEKGTVQKERIVRMAVELQDAETDVNDFHILIVMAGIFEIHTDDENIAAELLKRSTIAIMFPYARAQISLLTAQPGLEPIVLPPIDVGRFVEYEKTLEI